MVNSKLLVSLIALNSISLCGAGQNSGASSSSESKFFTEFGFSPFLGYERSPTSTYTYTEQTNVYNSSTGVYDYTTINQSGTVRFDEFDYLTFVFRARYNIIEFSKNVSLSVSVLPAIGLGVPANGDGALSLNIPLIIGCNIGNVATYTADMEKGLVVGVGVEYTKAPLIGGKIIISNSNGNETTVTVPTGWVEPVVELGRRFWNKNNKANELGVKFGYLANGAYTARLSWLICIGY